MLVRTLKEVYPFSFYDIINTHDKKRKINYNFTDYMIGIIFLSIPNRIFPIKY